MGQAERRQQFLRGKYEGWHDATENREMLWPTGSTAHSNKYMLTSKAYREGYQAGYTLGKLKLSNTTPIVRY